MGLYGIGFPGTRQGIAVYPPLASAVNLRGVDTPVAPAACATGSLALC